MRIRIRVAGHRKEATRAAALTGSMLLTPVSLGLFSLGGWRLLADMDVTARFFIDRGPLSHWQTWLALALILQTGAYFLSRFGENSREG
ncbi:MAG: hypothetical protein FJW30_00765 [Acidobacteria bacterium]|nr:hypothetical protein [Acidobacteriota bacterium]